MKQVLVIALLMFPIVALGANKGVRPYRGPAYVYEFPNPVMADDTITVRLRVEVRECVDEIEAHFRDWRDSLIILRQQVGESDTVAFDMCIRVPTSGGFDLMGYAVERTIAGGKPCTREKTVTDADGNVTVIHQDIGPGDEWFAIGASLKRVGNTVIVTEPVPLSFRTGRTKPDSSTPPRPRETQDERIAPQIREDSGGSSGIDSQQVAPKDTGREPAFVPRSEWTEEEKHRFDSLTGHLPWQRERARMAKLEETPLEGVGAEFIVVEGVTYMRNRGERKFRRAEVFSEEDFDSLPQPGAQSRIYRGEETEFEIRVWLSDSEDLKYARTLIDSLLPTDDANCFRARTSVKVIHLLEKRGIKTAPIAKVSPEPAGSNEFDSGSSSPEQRPTEGDATEDQVLLYSEGFGGTWPARWHAYDGLGSDSGEDHWGQVTCNYSSSYWSAWCSGSGDAIYCDAPAPRMNSVMSDTVGIDIAGMGRAVISYAAELDYPEGNYMISSKVFYSFDNHIWGELANHDTIAPVPWWDDYSFSLPEEGDRVYLRFAFHNHADQWDYSGDGVYIDDIEIVGWTPMNLTVLEGPQAWQGPLIISSQPGSQEWESPLYAGVTNYLDWCVRNTGAGNTGPFTVTVLIDNTWDIITVDTRHYENLGPGDSIIVEDFPWVCPVTGAWRLGLRVDKDLDNPRGETNTEDNSCHGNVMFISAPLLNVSGGLEIPDMWCDSSSTPNLPLSGYRLELWDYNVFGYPDSLIDSTYTDYDGTFVFPPVLNRDSEDTPLDIRVVCYISKDGAWIQDTLSTIDAVQDYKSSLAIDVADGDYSFGTMVVDDSTGGSFYALDRIVEARNAWLELGMLTPSDVRVIIRRFPTSAYSDGTIVLARAYGLWDDWDRSVIWHEYGHHLMHTLNILPRTDVDSTYHGWDTVMTDNPENRRLLSSESFANFWSAYVANNEWYMDMEKEFHTGEMCMGDSRNIETGENVLIRPERYDSSRSYNHFGYGCEASVSGLIWDIWDWNADDNSAFGTDSTWPPASVDGIGDSMCVDIRTILAVLTNTYELGRVPEDMAEFAYIWRQDSASLGNIREMRNVYYEHGVECWCGTRGNVSGDHDGVVDITDLNVLIDAMFLSLNDLACPQEANVHEPDEAFLLDVTDLQVLIDHMFLTLEPIPKCRPEDVGP
ncbi:MAG: hypothetical protein GY867_06050 [bacterium]|nr:hypothetical protein [bacterium]